MSFHNEPALQLAAIRTNIDSCSQTDVIERTALHAVVDGALAPVAHLALEAVHVSNVGLALGEKASAEDLFFKGSAKTIDKLVWHTKREDAMIRSIEIALRSSDPSLSAAERRSAAESLILDLSQATSFNDAIKLAGDFAMHWHGRPMWIAIPDAESPPIDDQIDYLPARLGLVPDDAVPTRYILVILELKQGFVPRVADSQGYPYWIAGGLTEPIEECPDGYSGLTELIANNVCVKNISQPFQNFLRMF